MTDEQRALYQALAARIAKEARVEAVWLAGSLGAGEGDAWSDVDLLVLAAGEPESLYPKGDEAFDFQRTASRLAEMRSVAWLEQARSSDD